MANKYKYGMRLRGFSIGCQPMEHLHDVRESDGDPYYSYLFYTEKLTEDQIRNFELDYLGEVTEQ